MNRILVTGASGFVGRHVVRALNRRMPGTPLRLLTHRTLPDPVQAGELVQANLADPASLAGVCEGVEGLVHAAVHVGEDAAVCERVNGLGTEALVEEARRAGVRRLVYLSNAAVYGWAVHHGASEADAEPAPATPVSRSRLRAERAVLAAGGVVLRPLFVYGEGDTRFIPAIMRALRRLPFMVDHGRARLSVVSVEDLAEAAGALASRTEPSASGVFHVSELEPVTFGEIALELARRFGFPLPRRSLPYPLARWVIRLGSPWLMNGAGWTPSADHRLFLVSRDHFYDASRLRSVLGLETSRFAERLPALASWYGRFTGPEGSRRGAA